MKKHDRKDFATVERTGRGMNFAWMPKVNTEPKFQDPWRPGKTTVFDLSRPLKDVIGEMALYHTRLLIAKFKTMTKMSEEMLMEYFSELLALSYERAFNGIRCWKPLYGLNVYVQNHVRFAAMSLKTKQEKDAEKGLNAVLVPNETVSGMNMSFREAMELAENYELGGNDGAAAQIYERIARQSSDVEGMEGE